MSDPATITADYTLRPGELADTLALLVEARQPAIVWGPPGCAKSQIAQQVAADAGRQYIDVRALLLDPVDLRGIPWRDGDDRTRWARPAFLPPSRMRFSTPPATCPSGSRSRGTAAPTSDWASRGSRNRGRARAAACT